MLQYCMKQIQTNVNKYILHVLSIKLRYKLQFSFSIPTPGFPHFYYMLGANLGVFLYGEVPVMPFGALDRMWNSIVSVPDPCLFVDLNF